MKVISIWQPWASLLIHGFKQHETRGWVAPRSIIGQRIGIASTRNIKALQRVAYDDPAFQEFYAETGLDELEDLPLGCLLGTVMLQASIPMTEEFLAAQSPQERMFGWFALDRHAWQVREPQRYRKPIPVRGAQGVWELSDDTIAQAEDQEAVAPARQAPRGDLHDRVR